MTYAAKYFVGIGAQRSGTTWLARQFEQHPDIGMCPIKEIHFWSSKYVAHQRGSVRSLQALELRISLLAKYCGQHPTVAPHWLAAYLGIMVHHDASYRKFVELGRNGASVAGEITPAYATLPKEGFAAMDRCLEEPKYLFLLRNPADRFISQIAHSSRLDRSIAKAKSAKQLLSRPAFALRSQYHETYRICQSIAGDNRLLIVFFEELLDPQTGPGVYNQICSYLGVIWELFGS